MTGSASISLACFGALAETSLKQCAGLYRSFAFGKMGLRKFAIARTRSPARETRALPRLKQLIRIDVDCHCDVFGEWQLVEGLTHKAAQTHDGFAADQDVKTELAL